MWTWLGTLAEVNKWRWPLKILEGLSSCVGFASSFTAPLAIFTWRVLLEFVIVFIALTESTICLPIWSSQQECREVTFVLFIWQVKKLSLREDVQKKGVSLLPSYRQSPGTRVRSSLLSSVSLNQWSGNFGVQWASDGLLTSAEAMAVGWSDFLHSGQDTKVTLWGGWQTAGPHMDWRWQNTFPLVSTSCFLWWKDEDMLCPTGPTSDLVLGTWIALSRLPAFSNNSLSIWALSGS